MNIQFFGSSVNSKIVKNTLVENGYTLVNKDPDLIIVADYGQIIPQKTLDSTKNGNLNLHPSLLPQYRGPTPVPSAILAKETQTGITIIEMIQEVDAGPIVAQQTIAIKPQDNSKTLLTRCFTLGSKLLIKILPDYIEHKITPKPQPTNSSTPLTKKFTKQAGFVSWQNFIKHSKNQFVDIDHKIRAFYPWPGIHTKMPNNRVLKLLPNQMLQLEGKQPISWQAFISGYQHLLK